MTGVWIILSRRARTADNLFWRHHVSPTAWPDRHHSVSCAVAPRSARKKSISMISPTRKFQRTCWSLQSRRIEDRYEEALKDLLRKKQSGQKIEAPKERAPAKVINLMDALRRSVQAERGRGGRRRRERHASASHRKLIAHRERKLASVAPGLAASGKHHGCRGGRASGCDFRKWCRTCKSVTT
jgi:hypothetical protein